MKLPSANPLSVDYVEKDSPKPVAWRIAIGGTGGTKYSYVERDLAPTYKCEPLYTSPPGADALLREALEIVCRAEVSAAMKALATTSAHT